PFPVLMTLYERHMCRPHQT
ncbi:hypothetical protein AVEN_207482-1, partial [Araneus ventricosus]